MSTKIKEEGKMIVKKKPPYRALKKKEIGMLFAFYEKWNSNMLAMTRDVLCPFRSDSQIRYYAKLYGFHEKFIEIKRKRAEEIISSLGDGKILAIQRAMELVEPRLVVVLGKDGKAVLNGDGSPLCEKVYPDAKDIKTAWEIIKTELGEATSVNKHDHTTKGEKILFVPAELLNKHELNHSPQSSK